MFPGGAIFVPSPPKTGTNLRHPLPPQSLNDYIVVTTVDEYILKSAYHTVKKGCAGYEDLRRPENINPLREVDVQRNSLTLPPWNTLRD